MKIVKVSFPLFVDLFTEGKEFKNLVVTKGIPKGSTFAGFKVDRGEEIVELWFNEPKEITEEIIVTFEERSG